MSDEPEEVVDGETPVEQPAPEETSAPVEAPSETPQDAGTAVEQKAGDTCTCPDGRIGTLHAGDQEGTFVCIPNQG
jgi:hypothetical protein